MKSTKRLIFLHTLAAVYNDKVRNTNEYHNVSFVQHLLIKQTLLVSTSVFYKEFTV